MKTKTQIAEAPDVMFSMPFPILFRSDDDSFWSLIRKAGHYIYVDEAFRDQWRNKFHKHQGRGLMTLEAVSFGQRASMTEIREFLSAIGKQLASVEHLLVLGYQYREAFIDLYKMLEIMERR
ncbi:MAG: hypothetical protein RL536_372, partial [Candidatus Parcubacteria bacterium]